MNSCGLTTKQAFLCCCQSNEAIFNTHHVYYEVCGCWGRTSFSSWVKPHTQLWLGAPLLYIKYDHISFDRGKNHICTMYSKARQDKKKSWGPLTFSCLINMCLCHFLLVVYSSPSREHISNFNNTTYRLLSTFSSSLSTWPLLQPMLRGNMGLRSRRDQLATPLFLL